MKKSLLVTLILVFCTAPALAKECYTKIKDIPELCAGDTFWHKISSERHSTLTEIMYIIKYYEKMGVRLRTDEQKVDNCDNLKSSKGRLVAVCNIQVKFQVLSKMANNEPGGRKIASVFGVERKVPPIPVNTNRKTEAVAEAQDPNMKSQDNGFQVKLVQAPRPTSKSFKGPRNPRQ